MDAHPTLHPTDQTLSSYGLGKLDDGLAEAVNMHLEQCAVCRQRVAEMSADSFLGRLREARGGPDAPGRIVSSLAGLSMLATGSHAPAQLAIGTLPPGLADHPDYEILRELGQGGMGVVYLAENKLMGRKEVLKVVSSHLLNRKGVLERFLGEIRNAARLHHPNIVTAYAALRIGESLVLAMEYVEGLDLAKMVKARGRLPVASAANYAHQAALGLQHAHEHGMVHRDIKPGNLMLAPQGYRAVVKVLDFGLAKVSREVPADGALTYEGQMLGTPDFIAPEQSVDARNADIRADIYSLGCTLYYFLTGGPPFQGKSLYDILQAHHSRDALPLNLARPEVPVELAALVGKMMAKEPHQRFQTPSEVSKALTPFFKKGNAAPVGWKPEVCQLGQPEVEQKSSAVSVPTRPAPERVPLPAARKPSEPTRPGSILEGLIDLRDTDPLFDVMLDRISPIAAPGLSRRVPRAWSTAVEKLGGIGPRGWWVAAALVLFGLVVAWAAVVFKIKTKDGVIVVDELPKDAEVFVDRERITLTWPGIGKPAEIRVPAGRHGVEVQKDGIKIFGEEVSIEVGDQKRIRVRLEPAVAVPREHMDTSANSSARYGLRFDPARNSYVRLNKLKYDGSHPITLEAYITPLVSPGYAATIISCAEGSGIELVVRSGGNACLDAHSRGEYHALLSRGSLIGKRAHIAGVLADGHLSLFVNGKLEGSLDLPGPFDPSPLPFYVGCNPNLGAGPTMLFSGIIEQVRISNSARYRTDFDPVEQLRADSNTLLLYQFKRDTDKIAVDASGHGNDGMITGAELVPLADAPRSARSPINRLSRATIVSGTWRVEGAELEQSDGSIDAGLAFGDMEWSNYDLTLDIKKVRGSGHGIWVVFHRLNADAFGWFGLGVYNNAGCELYFRPNPGRKGDRSGDKHEENWVWRGIDEGRWYSIKIKVRGSSFEFYLDNELILEESNSSFSRGQIGLGTGRVQARFRRIRVTSPDGKVLFEGLPDIDSKAGGTGG